MNTNDPTTLQAVDTAVTTARVVRDEARDTRDKIEADLAGTRAEVERISALDDLQVQPADIAADGILPRRIPRLERELAEAENKLAAAESALAAVERRAAQIHRDAERAEGVRDHGALEADIGRVVARWREKTTALREQSALIETLDKRTGDAPSREDPAWEGHIADGPAQLFLAEVDPSAEVPEFLIAMGEALARMREDADRRARHRAAKAEAAAQHEAYLAELRRFNALSPEEQAVEIRVAEAAREALRRQQLPGLSDASGPGPENTARVRTIGYFGPTAEKPADAETPVSRPSDVQPDELERYRENLRLRDAADRSEDEQTGKYDPFPA